MTKQPQTTPIHCCACEKKVDARLTDGREIYPHRPDLFSLPFWKCDTCWNFVGCHHKTRNRTQPLGCIPTPEIKNARQHIHRILDPLWQSGRVTRKSLYAYLSRVVGWDYHTAKTRTIDECRTVWKAIRALEVELPW